MKETVIRYLTSGAMASFSNFFILSFCVEILKIPPSVASPIAYSCGASINYLLHYYWTFNSDGRHHVVATKYIIVTCLTAMLNTFAFWILFHVLGVYYLISQMLALILVVPFSFQLNRRYTFIT